MHVDGAATAGFLALPESLILSGDIGSARRNEGVYVILNGRLRPKFEVVEPSTFAIIGRALNTVLSAHDRSTLLSLEQFSATNDVAFQLTYIGPDFDQETDGLFSTEYMNALCVYGLARGRMGTWYDTLEKADERP